MNQAIRKECVGWYRFDIQARAKIAIPQVSNSKEIQGVPEN
jgi:hypothetical protein